MSDAYTCRGCDNFDICKFSDGMLDTSNKIDEIIANIPEINGTKLAKIHVICNKYTAKSMVTKR